MGNTTLAREDARAVWIGSWLESVRQDVQYAVRNLRRQPGFALLALTTLGSAIGINTSLFTTFNALFLRAWPIVEPSSVFEVKVVYGGNVASANEEFSLEEYGHLRERTRSLSGLVASTCIDDRDAACRVKLDREPVGTLFVSRNYFSVLGIPLEGGRGLDGPENRPDAVAIISYGLWQRRLGGDASIIGKRIQLNDAPFTVVGIIARHFTGTSFGRKDVWIPIAAKALVHREESDAILLRLAGRLRNDVPRAQAVSELDILHRQFRSALAPTNDPGRDLGRITLARTSFNPNPGKTRPAFRAFGVLSLGTLLVLILACANVGNLLLARGATRGRELAVRLSLGAPRRRVIRQLLTESVVLAGLAALVGTALAYVIPPLFVDWIYAQFGAFGTRPFSVSPDTVVLAWTAGLVVVTCVAFGLAPALLAVRESTTDTLKRNAAGGGSRLRLRNVLLGAQVVVSVILLTAAALLVRSVQHAANLDLGFVAEDVAVLSFDFPASYQPATRAAFARQLLNVLATLGETRSAGLAMTVPFGGEPEQVRFRQPGNALEWVADAPEVTGGYFEILRIRLVAGRTFGPTDEGRDVIVVDELLAATLWPNRTPLGDTIVIDGTPREIVGVVKGADTAGRIFRGRAARMTIYRPLGPTSFSRGSVPRVLAHGGGLTAVTSLTTQATRIDPRVEIKVTSLKDNIDRQLSPIRVGAMVAAVLGVVAVTFASIGVFGVFAYVVQQRSREIGVRMALGAQPRQVVGFILRSGSRSLLAGLGLGCLGAVVGSKLIEWSLLGISRIDPIAYGAVVLVLGTAAAFALYLPARRAARVDPVRALRYE